MELVFDPFDLTRVEVRYNNRPMGAAVPVVIGRHSHPAARPEPGAEEPPPATGIDYLHLVEARADAELSRRISYAGIGARACRRNYLGGPVPGPDGDGQAEEVAE